MRRAQAQARIAMPKRGGWIVPTRQDVATQPIQQRRDGIAR